MPDNLVVIDCKKLAHIGGPYVLIPTRLRPQPLLLENGKYPYNVLFLQAPGSNDVIIRVEKIED